MRARNQHLQVRRRITVTICLVAALVTGLFSCRNGENDMARPTATSDIATIQVMSSAFEEGGPIPQRYTCDGEEISPPLSWESVPEGTQSIVLIADDPDAPRGTFVHWVLYDLPANARELPEDTPRDKILANGARQGINDGGDFGYMGPCPPSGTHRYFFKVYALDTRVNLPPGNRKADLLKVMEGHILAQGQTISKYGRR
jgi:Raf kinase inhibitor-like YbhB/YbcL family protein